MVMTLVAATTTTTTIMMIMISAHMMTIMMIHNCMMTTMLMLMIMVMMMIMLMMTLWLGMAMLMIMMTANDDGCHAADYHDGDGDADAMDAAADDYVYDDCDDGASSMGIANGTIWSAPCRQRSWHTWHTWLGLCIAGLHTHETTSVQLHVAIPLAL